MAYEINMMLGLEQDYIGRGNSHDLEVRGLRRQVRTRPLVLRSEDASKMPDEHEALEARYRDLEYLGETMRKTWKLPDPKKDGWRSHHNHCTCGPEHQVKRARESDDEYNGVEESLRNAEVVRCIVDSTKVLEERVIKDVVDGRCVVQKMYVRLYIVNPPEAGLATLPPELLHEIWLLSKNAALPFASFGLAVKLMWTSAQAKFVASIRESTEGRQGLMKVLATVPTRGRVDDESQKAIMKTLAEIPKPDYSHYIAQIAASKAQANSKKTSKLGHRVGARRNAGLVQVYSDSDSDSDSESAAVLKQEKPELKPQASLPEQQPISSLKAQSATPKANRAGYRVQKAVPKTPARTPRRHPAVNRVQRAGDQDPGAMRRSRQVAHEASNAGSRAQAGPLQIMRRMSYKLAASIFDKLLG